MRKLLLALPLASLLLLVGCNEPEPQATGFTSPTTTRVAASAAPAPAQQVQQAQPAQPAVSAGRRSTTQPLPSGYGYIHEQDLNSGRLTTTPAPTTTAQSGAQKGGI